MTRSLSSNDERGEFYVCPNGHRFRWPQAVECDECDARVAMVPTAEVFALHRQLKEAVALARELRQFVPYEKPEQGRLPGWISQICERADAFLAAQRSDSERLPEGFTDAVRAGGRAIQESGYEFTSSEARDLAHVVLSAVGGLAPDA